MSSRLTESDAKTLATSEGRHPRATAVSPQPTPIDEVPDPLSASTYTEMARLHNLRVAAELRKSTRAV